MSDYYEVNLKKSRLEILKKNPNFYNNFGLIQDEKLLDSIFSKYKPNIVIHLAAQAGVRYSIINPLSYVETNLLGTFYILEMTKRYKPDHLLMASTSSVYGSNTDVPFHENQKTDSPISFYAATKKSNEIMAHSYSHLHNIPITLFRFFTVYGPWGRPDMAYFKFTKKILSGKPIDIYNNGNMFRDFTYVDDLVKAIYLLITKEPQNISERSENIPNDSISKIAPFRIVNIGNSQPIKLLEFVKILEQNLKKIAVKNFLDAQDGDVFKTHSKVDLLFDLTGYRPNTSLQYGLSEFVKWYKEYYSKTTL